MANEISENVSKLFELVDKHIVQECFERPVARNEEDGKKLQELISNYSLAPNGTADSPTSGNVNGKKLVLDPNPYNIESVAFSTADGLKLKIIRDGKTVMADCGLNGEWKENSDYPLKDAASSLSPVIKGYEPAKVLGYEPNQPWLLSAAWITENQLQINARRMDLMCMVSQIFTFADQSASVRIHYHFLPGNSPKNPDIVLPGVLA